MTKLQDFLNSPVSALTLVNNRTDPGDLFGIELECEGRNVDWDGTDDILKGWQALRDGSLRNNHGQSCEWIFNGPVNYAESTKRIDNLFDYFSKRKSKLICSNRTSTHVHFNMSDKQGYQVINLFIIFTILEDILDNYCGEDRNGNLFCLSSRHAEAQVERVENACTHNFNFAGFDHNFRYCSLNLASLNKFGSVEFRAMRGLDNREDMKSWLDIINELCQYACYKMKNPKDLIEEVSLKGPLGLLNQIFSKESVHNLTKDVSEQDLSVSIYEGLRLVQMLCYRVGAEFDQVRLVGKDFWAALGEEEGVAPKAPNAVKKKKRAARGVREARPGDWMEIPRPVGVMPRPLDLGHAGPAVRIEGRRGDERPVRFRAQPINPLEEFDDEI